MLRLRRGVLFAIEFHLQPVVLRAAAFQFRQDARPVVAPALPAEDQAAEKLVLLAAELAQSLA